MVRPDLEMTIVVASGRSADVRQWCRVLKSAGITFEVTKPCVAAEAVEYDHSEVWISRDDADKARSVIRSADGDKSHLW
jgi:hypothetical protein